MRTAEIKRKIRDAIADEKQTGRLSKTLKETANQQGIKLNKEAVQEIVSFVREYIEHVPLFLEQGENAAKQMGLDKEMGQMLKELESYWFQVDDLVPDYLGLMGLMDDAYASLFLLQSLSDYSQATFGRPLLQQNLSAANQGIRGLIGDPVVSILEQRVGITVANAMMHRILEQVTINGSPFGSSPDPIWGNASMDEIVTARLGAMGVV